MRASQSSQQSAGAQNSPSDSPGLSCGDDDSNNSSIDNSWEGTMMDDDGEAIVRNIASFMTLSDAASLVSLGMGTHVSDVNVTPADSWAVGLGIDGTASWASLTTPPTPALVALSPGATPSMPTPYHHAQQHTVSPTASIPSHESDHDEFDQSGEHFKFILQERRRKWAQEKLATAVYSHPRSLRSFCLAAYKAANDIRKQQTTLKERADPETWVEPMEPVKIAKRQDPRVRFLHEAVDFIFNNVPLSVFLEAVDCIGNVTLDTTFACFSLAGASVNGVMSALVHIIHVIWDTATSIVSNPFKLLEMIVSLQFNAMGKTSEVLVSGIQSVATGVESASSIALHKLSAANLSTKGGSASSMGLDRGGSMRRGRGSYNKELNRKLLSKMSSINDAARVVRYTETKDDTGGLTRHAISRTRRMMHYSVSLRPFVATVTVRPSEVPTALLTDSPDNSPEELHKVASRAEDDGSGASVDSNGSPVICSPQSFPPTPHSRQMVLARGSQFADDVVFLARDRLRIHDGLESDNERTREMAQALKEGKRLAIFDGNGAHGIELTCGQHIATKVGSMHYASTRSMVPILRNCYVYFEVTVMPRSPLDPLAQQAPLTLAIGVSTVEMPPNTLVGAWQGSVGLCTTGQIFVAGQWCSPLDPSMGAYSYGATVGCLVFLDDSSAFETWDGVMVNAYVTFNINGLLVPPPSSAMAMPGVGAQQLSAHKQYRHMSQSPTFSNSSPSALASSPPLTTAAPPSWRVTIPRTTTQTLLVPASEELYPTVTLQTPSTAVMCRFSSEDMLTSSTKESIGVPPGVTVYSVDGTMLFSNE